MNPFSRENIRAFLLFTAVCSAILMHTSVLNVGDTGIPLFYAIFPLLILLLPFAGVFDLRVPQHVFLFFLSSVLILLSVSALHSLFAIGDTDKELKQIISRVMYVAFFVASVIIVREAADPDRVWRWLKNGLKLAIVYGFYQFGAGFVGLPLFLDFLRNSKSFLMTENYEGGWINTFRAFSIWAEPSAAAIPVGVFLFILLFKTESRGEKTRWLLAVTVFSAITFSRVVWAVWLISVLVYVIFRIENRLFRATLAFATRWRYVLGLGLVLLLMNWGMFASEDADSSTAIRSSTIVMGQRIFVEHPLLGTGLNSFAKMSESVATSYSDEDLIVVHNLFVSYAQQLGILGALLSMLPIWYVLWLSPANSQYGIFFAAMFIVTGSLGGDFLYSPFAWLVIAALAVGPRSASRVSLTQPFQAPIGGEPQTL